jgi:hypothetical protein
MIQRMAQLAIIGVLALGLTATSPASGPSPDHLTPQDAALLHFEPGEWQISAPASPETKTVTICFDASLSERFVDMSRIAGLVRCDKTVITKTRDGFTLHSVCEAVRGQIVTTDVVRHVTDNAHFTQHAKNAWMRGKRPLTTEIMDSQAVRLGACPAGARPGDLEAAGLDTKLNLNDLMRPPPTRPDIRVNQDPPALSGT